MSHSLSKKTFEALPKRGKKLSIQKCLSFSCILPSSLSFHHQIGASVSHQICGHSPQRRWSHQQEFVDLGNSHSQAELGWVSLQIVIVFLLVNFDIISMAANFYFYFFSSFFIFFFIFVVKHTTSLTRSVTPVFIMPIPYSTQWTHSIQRQQVDENFAIRSWRKQSYRHHLLCHIGLYAC